MKIPNGCYKEMLESEDEMREYQMKQKKRKEKYETEMRLSFQRKMSTRNLLKLTNPFNGKMRYSSSINSFVDPKVYHLSERQNNNRIDPFMDKINNMEKMDKKTNNVYHLSS